jgi:hypothetical protein
MLYTKAALLYMLLDAYCAADNKSCSLIMVDLFGAFSRINKRLLLFHCEKTFAVIVNTLRVNYNLKY